MKKHSVTHVCSPRQLAARKDLFKPKTGSQGHGLLAFWNDKAVALSWNKVTWNYAHWDHFLDEEVENVSHVLVFCPDLLVVAADGNIYFLDVKKKIVKVREKNVTSLLYFYSMLAFDCNAIV